LTSTPKSLLPIINPLIPSHVVPLPPAQPQLVPVAELVERDAVPAPLVVVGPFLHGADAVLEEGLVGPHAPAQRLRLPDARLHAFSGGMLARLPRVDEFLQAPARGRLAAAFFRRHGWGGLIDFLPPIAKEEKTALRSLLAPAP
jgi:hypothetical protein